MTLFALILHLISSEMHQGMIDDEKYYKVKEKIRCEELFIEPNEFVICDIVPSAKKYGIRNRYVWKYEEIKDKENKTIYVYYLKHKKDYKNEKLTVFYFY